MCMKTILKHLAILIYLVCLALSIFYSILNPREIYSVLSNWEGTLFAKFLSGVLISGWIFIGIIAIWMIIDNWKQIKKRD